MAQNANKIVNAINEVVEVNKNDVKIAPAGAPANLNAPPGYHQSNTLKAPVQPQVQTQVTQLPQVAQAPQIAQVQAPMQVQTQVQPQIMQMQPQVQQMPIMQQQMPMMQQQMQMVPQVMHSMKKRAVPAGRPVKT